MFLLDKYPIKSTDDIVFHEDIYRFLGLLDDGEQSKSFRDLPHLLFYGRSGSGKKSIINMLLEKIYGKGVHKTKTAEYVIYGYGNTKQRVKLEQSKYHIVIEPNNSGLDKYMIQEIVKDYAGMQGMTLFGSDIPFKIVFINNVDNLNYYAQTALRCTMEKYVRTCKFILCGKQISKIIEPLRSRCLLCRVPSPTKKEIFKTLLQIAGKEERVLTLEQYHNILENCSRDIKQAVWLLEFTFHQIPFDFSWKDAIGKLVERVHKISKSGYTMTHITAIRKTLYDIFITNIEGTDIITEIMSQLINSIEDPKLMSQIVDFCAKYETRLSVGKRCILHLEGFMNECIYSLAKVGTEVTVKLYQGKWTVEDALDNPNMLFIFGSNDQDYIKWLKGEKLKPGKGQAVIQCQKNALGIPTKKRPNKKEDAFYNDKELHKNRKKIKQAINNIKIAVEKEGYLAVVFPSDGLGTGLAKLPVKAPKTYEFLNQEIEKLMEDLQVGSSKNVEFLKV